ncbi:MAG: winged helix-turn-helix domain-containing protein [Rickettsiales bacterium]|nr:winged helix-turn-helix domain-containing protein [Rickettsiales bacterium]
MILILSDDSHFTGVLCEQIELELKKDCQVLANFSDIKSQVTHKIDIVVTTLADTASLPEPRYLLNPAYKPFSVQKIISDIRNILADSSKEVLTIGDLSFSPLQKQLTSAHSNAISLLPDKEAQLLVLLYEAGKQGVDKELLLKKIWGIEAALDTHTLETHISRLRTKLRELESKVGIEATANGYALTGL